MNIDIDKVMKYKMLIYNNLTRAETSKLFREILYDIYETLDDGDIIHCYQLTRDMIDIFTQMINGRKFDEKYLKDKIKW